MSYAFLLNTQQAAEYLGLAVTTLEKFRVYGNGPAFLRLGKRSVRYRPLDLDAWVESRIRTSTSDTGLGHVPIKRIHKPSEA